MRHHSQKSVKHASWLEYTSFSDFFLQPDTLRPVDSCETMSRNENHFPFVFVCMSFNPRVCLHEKQQQHYSSNLPNSNFLYGVLLASRKPFISLYWHIQVPFFIFITFSVFTFVSHWRLSAFIYHLTLLLHLVFMSTIIIISERNHTSQVL